jgi:hypothetical protein
MGAAAVAGTLGFQQEIAVRRISKGLRQIGMLYPLFMIFGQFLPHEYSCCGDST